LLDRATAAANQDSAERTVAMIGEGRNFFEEFQDALLRARTSADAALSADQPTDLGAQWQEAVRENDLPKMRSPLPHLANPAHHFRSTQGTVRPRGNTTLSDFSRPPPSPQAPAENVAPLGRSLFTDYILPVELAGLLLLVATVGAIAITHRRARSMP